MAEPLIIRASSLPSYQDCQLRVLANSHSHLAREHGWELADARGNIGAVMGTGVHKGAEVGLTEKMVAGGMSPLSTLEDAAVAELHVRLAEERESTREIVMDDDTPSLSVAERQVRRMVAVVREDIIQRAHPLAVEGHVEATLREGIVLSGHSDLLHLSGEHAVGMPTIRDLKTGRRKKKAVVHAPQLGAYSLLFRTVGHSPQAAQIDFVQRVGLKKPQPAAVEQPLPLAGIEAVAWSVLLELGDKLEAFARDGDPSRFIPNASSNLCDERFCRAFGTKLCPLTGGTT